MHNKLDYFLYTLYAFFDDFYIYKKNDVFQKKVVYQLKYYYLIIYYKPLLYLKISRIADILLFLKIKINDIAQRIKFIFLTTENTFFVKVFIFILVHNLIEHYSDSSLIIHIFLNKIIFEHF